MSRLQPILATLLIGSMLAFVRPLTRCFSEEPPVTVHNSPTASVPREEPPASIAEARARAVLLHDTFESMLTVIHHEYYREDEGLTLPAAAFRGVFDELSTKHHVKLRWLAVDGQAMNIEHTPKSEFEKQVVAALSGGMKEIARAEQGVYQRAGLITLTSDCLKCHLPQRKSTSNRAAALIISLPLNE